MRRSQTAARLAENKLRACRELGQGVTAFERPPSFAPAALALTPHAGRNSCQAAQKCFNCKLTYITSPHLFLCSW